MRSGSPHDSRGFAYVLLLVAVAVISLAATAAVQVGAAVARRDAEEELLAIGGEFERAFRSYAGRVAQAPPTAGATSAGPRSLDDLLRDPRVAGVRRHLRRIHADPITGKPEWGLVKDASGGIRGVYSLASGTPMKRTGFESHRGHMEDADSYEDWVFGAGGVVGKPRRHWLIRETGAR